MANPQKENGFTPIANEILEQIVKLPLNGTQLRILLVVWRYTYGFSRKSHEISETFIANATGITKRHIANELSKLISQNILVVVRPATSKTPRKLEFNKDYDKWSRTILPQMSKSSTDEQSFISGVNNSSTLEMNNSSTLEMNNSSSKKEIYKEKYKENIKEIAATINDPIEEIANVFFELTGRLANGKDYVSISGILKKYSDIEVITRVMKTVTEKKTKRDPQDKIKSFSFYVGAIEDEFRKIEAKKAGEGIGRTQADTQTDYEYDYSKLYYKGGTTAYNDEDIDF